VSRIARGLAVFTLLMVGQKSKAWASEVGSAVAITGWRTTSLGDSQFLAGDELARELPSTLLQPLDRVPAAHAFSKAGRSFLSIRGGEPNFTLTLVNGIRVNDPTNSRGGAFDFEQIAPELVERVELGTSALSAVYGPDALSGVVHIRLRSALPGPSSVEWRIRADTLGGASAQGTIGLSGQRTQALAALSTYASAGTEDERWTRRNALLQLSRGLGAYSLRLLAFRSQTDWTGFPEDSGGRKNPASEERENRGSSLTLAGLEFEPLFHRPLEAHISVGWARQDTDTKTPSIPAGVLRGVPAISDHSRFDRIDANAHVLFRRRNWLQVAVGASLGVENGSSSGVVNLGVAFPTTFKLRRTTRGAFGEVTLIERNISVTASLRYDRLSSEAEKLTARAGLRAQLTPHASAFFELANGFKLPSFFALGYPLVANPALRPERGRTITVGLDRYWRHAKLAIWLYANRYEDLIDFDPEHFTNVNRAQVRSSGIEIDGRITITPRLTTRATLAYNHLRNDVGAPPLRGRPEWRGTAELDWNPSAAWRLSLISRFQSQTYDSSIPTGIVSLPGYGVLNGTVNWRFLKQLVLQASVQNLTAEKYEEVVGVSSSGRSLRVAAILQM
jgi:vitamin B12 transporter